MAGACQGGKQKSLPSPLTASAELNLPVKAATGKENSAARSQLSFYIVCSAVLLLVNGFDRHSHWGEVI